MLLLLLLQLLQPRLPDLPPVLLQLLPGTYPVLPVPAWACPLLLPLLLWTALLLSSHCLAERHQGPQQRQRLQC